MLLMNDQLLINATDMSSNLIKMNDLLKMNSLNRVKIRFIKSYESSNPLELFHGDRDQLFAWLLWNYRVKKSFKEGDTVIGLVRVDNDKWLLFDVCTIIKDLNIHSGVGYERKAQCEFEKYIGRVIIQYKNKSQNLIRNATSVMDECVVHQILSNEFNNDLFPGYENVNVSWKNLKRLINNNAWKTALENQKGVYLLTDKSNGKMYVGAAYGENMIHGRWRAYVRTGHGGNVDLKKLGFEYIKENFSYSILEIYKSTIDDNTILARENWWKSVLQTRIYGYNLN